MDAAGTRKTLINRLRQTNSDTRSWSEFYNLYWKLVYSVALKAGLSETDAEDVVQETFLKVSKSIKKFEYDPSKGRFRSWLCLITKQQVANHYRKAKKLPELPSFWNEDPDEPARQTGRDCQRSTVFVVRRGFICYWRGSTRGWRRYSVISHRGSHMPYQSVLGDTAL